MWERGESALRFLWYSHICAGVLIPFDNTDQVKVVIGQSGFVRMRGEFECAIAYTCSSGLVATLLPPVLFHCIIRLGGGDERYLTRRAGRVGIHQEDSYAEEQLESLGCVRRKGVEASGRVRGTSEPRCRLPPHPLQRATKRDGRERIGSLLERIMGRAMQRADHGARDAERITGRATRRALSGERPRCAAL